MLEGKKCKLMKIYVSEDAKHEGHNLYNEIVFKSSKPFL